MLREWQRTNGERGKRSVTLSSFGGSNPPLSTNTLIVDNSCWGDSVKDVLSPLSVLYGFIFMLSTNNNI